MPASKVYFTDFRCRIGVSQCRLQFRFVPLNFVEQCVEGTGQLADFVVPLRVKPLTAVGIRAIERIDLTDETGQGASDSKTQGATETDGGDEHQQHA